jgi:hypothetical protein
LEEGDGSEVEEEGEEEVGVEGVGNDSVLGFNRLANKLACSLDKGWSLNNKDCDRRMVSNSC